MKTILNQNYEAVSAPVLRSIEMSSTLFIPDEDKIIILGDDVDITINGVTISMMSGAMFGVIKGIEYKFSNSIAIGMS